MKKPQIHFSHANGFPAESYRQLFLNLQDQYEIGYINIHGHNPDYPVTDNWNILAEELSHYIEKHYNEPVIGIGHSLGGVLTFIAAIHKPELFSAIVLLDAPIFNTWRCRFIRWTKRLGIVDKLTPGYRSKSRRTEWPSLTAALEYFSSKSLFREFNSESLRDYVTFGTEKTENGVRLKFDNQIEYSIYCTLPHDTWKYKGKLQVPAGLIYGNHSYAVTKSDLRNMRNAFNMSCVAIKGGHLFPFENPKLTADSIKRMLVNIQAKVKSA